MCIGRNYADHISELNNARPKQPFFFLKPPSAILLPDEGPILRPAGVTMHYEIELGLVLGRTVRDLDAEDPSAWQDAIASYVLAIDMTARNVQDEAKKKGVDKNDERLREVLIASLKGHVAKLGERQETLKKELDKELAEKSKKITTEDIHEGFESHVSAHLYSGQTCLC